MCIRDSYEVEFYANGTEYDYDIDQATGRILSSDFDIATSSMLLGASFFFANGSA